MKKIYIISTVLILLFITAGILFFTLRDSNAKIPDDFSLMTSDGELYSFSKDDKKLKLIEFIYTNCPDICPTTTQKMNLLKKDLINEGIYGKDIEFITITIDPYRDTPEVLTTYKETFEIKNDKNWIFLTGDPEKNTLDEQRRIAEVANAFQFQFRDPGNGFFVHSSFTFLVDEENKFIKKFPMGEEFDKQKVFDKILEVSLSL